MADTEIQKRQTAYKVWIKDIIHGKYQVEEGWNPNFLTTDYGLKVSRINLIGTIVQASNEEEEQKYIFIDDGSGELPIRSFNDEFILKGLHIGDTVAVIGKIREYNDDKYVVPEIVKKLDNNRWLHLRRIELEKKEKLLKRIPLREEKPDNEVSKENLEESKSDTDSDKILTLIKKLDSGDGADLDEVIKESKDEKCENIINNLLMNGEIFELKPGKIKVLE